MDCICAPAVKPPIARIGAEVGCCGGILVVPKAVAGKNGAGDDDVVCAWVGLVQRQGRDVAAGQRARRGAAAA
jgi:hypothetical protein